MKHIFGTRNRQAGFTLVELLVGLTLSLVLISGLLAFIAPTVAALSNVKSATDLQDSGRIGMELIHDAVSYAGYQGCQPDTTYTSPLNPIREGVSPRLAGWAYGVFGLRGFDADETQTMADFLGNAWRNAQYRFNRNAIGDVLIVQNPVGEELILQEHRPSQFELVFQGNTTEFLSQGRIIQLNDCQHAARVQISTTVRSRYSAASNTTSVSYSPADTMNCSGSGVTTLSLGPASSTGCTNSAAHSEPVFRYRTGTRAHVVNSSAYYIGFDAASGAPALKRSGFAANAKRVHTETLIEGVENLRFRYGLDTNADGLPDQVFSAAEINARRYDASSIKWENVINVMAWIMVRSTNRTTTAGHRHSLSFPTTEGAIVSCDTTPSEIDPAYRLYVLACPFQNNEVRQYKRRIFTQELSRRNPGT